MHIRSYVAQKKDATPPVRYFTISPLSPLAILPLVALLSLTHDSSPSTSLGSLWRRTTLLPSLLKCGLIDIAELYTLANDTGVLIQSDLGAIVRQVFLICVAK